MNAVLKRLGKLSDDELYRVSEAIDSELHRRGEHAEAFLESPKYRAGQRSQSYAWRYGSTAPPAARKPRSRPVAA